MICFCMFIYFIKCVYSYNKKMKLLLLLVLLHFFAPVWLIYMSPYCDMIVDLCYYLQRTLKHLYNYNVKICSQNLIQFLNSFKWEQAYIIMYVKRKVIYRNIHWSSMVYWCFSKNIFYLKNVSNPIEHNYLFGNNDNFFILTFDLEY